MPSAFDFFTIASALLYLVPKRYKSHFEDGTVTQTITFGPFLGTRNYQFEFGVTHDLTTFIPTQINFNRRPPTVHPERPAQRQRRHRRRNRNRNRRNYRLQQENLGTTVPAPPYQPREPSANITVEQFLDSIIPQIPSVTPNPNLIPVTVVSNRGQPIDPRRPTPYPIRVPRPALPILAPDHQDTRLAIRSGPPPVTPPRTTSPPTTSVLTAWVINRERQRVERYFHSDRHKFGASALESIGFTEAEESDSKEIKDIFINYSQHIRYNKRELSLVSRIQDIIRSGTFNDQIRLEYIQLHSEIKTLRILIQETADSVRYLPNSLRFEFIPSYQTVINQAAVKQDREETPDDLYSPE